MYVVTFYSFKGGAGRTLAMVNVGVALAQRGKSVLLVDFDLEAPGLHTFPDLQVPSDQLGLIDYVTEYAVGRCSPDVSQYVFRHPNIGSQCGGALYVLPSGAAKCSYQSTVSNLNWRELYEQMHGYLMFEDLKAQWRNTLNVDYVLIDSRTGFSDTAGITTRQLPNAVVVILMPTHQTINGLKSVVPTIKSEHLRSRAGNPIRLQFVLSNIPDIDDEDGILKQLCEKCKSLFGYNDAVTIHNYPSLSLLDQSVFTLSRPNTRLAQEYCVLADTVSELNYEDPVGALRLIEKVSRKVLQLGAPQLDVDDSLARIEEHQRENGEVLLHLGILRVHEGRVDDASALFNRAIETGTAPVRAFLERASLRMRMSDPNGAIADVKLFLENTDVSGLEAEKAVRMLGSLNPSALSEVPGSAAVRSLIPSAHVLIARALAYYPGGEALAYSMLRRLLDNGDVDREIRQLARSELVLTAIGMGKFSEALSLFDGFASSKRDGRSIERVFNYGMALWGLHKSPAIELFKEVVSREIEPELADPNYQQCLALSHGVIGNTSDGLERIELAIRLATELKKAYFSCWRYRIALPSQFLADCEAIRGFITNRVPDTPAFVEFVDSSSVELGCNS